MKKKSCKTGQGMDESMLEELLNGFAHDLKNPLASIKGALKVVAGRIPQEDPNRDVIEKILSQVGRINLALQELMEFTRVSASDCSTTDINGVVEQALNRIQSDCKRHGVTIEKNLSKDLPDIEIDANQVALGFHHLFFDMIKAMPQGGKLVVRSTKDPSGHILLEIEDTGCSIQEAHMERLFKPFLSTMGRGAGTGLSIAKRILNQNGGSIHAYNRGAEGLTFRVVFPFSL